MPRSSASSTPSSPNGRRPTSMPSWRYVTASSSWSATSRARMNAGSTSSAAWPMAPRSSTTCARSPRASPPSWSASRSAKASFLRWTLRCSTPFPTTPTSDVREVAHPFRDLFTMSSGLAWDENRAVVGPAQQRRSDDHVGRPVPVHPLPALAFPPGAFYTYYGGDTSLIGEALVRSTGRLFAIMRETSSSCRSTRRTSNGATSASAASSALSAACACDRGTRPSLDGCC